MTARPETKPSARDRAVALALIVVLAGLGAVPLTALWRAFGPKVIAAPDFALIDQDGRAFTLAGLRGHPVVLFFGYTHCPDVCPTTLAHLAQALHSPTVPADENVVFITVDPQRDSPAVLKRYMRLFDPKFVGLTGSLATLEPIYAAYHMPRASVPADHGRNDYSIVHGTSLYYVGRSGVIKGFGGWQDDTSELTQDLARFQ